MIKLHVEKYCQNCTEFEAETQVDVNRVYSDGIVYGREEIVSVNTLVTCKHAERCASIRDLLKEELRKESIE